MTPTLFAHIYEIPSIPVGLVVLQVPVYLEAPGFLLAPNEEFSVLRFFLHGSHRSFVSSARLTPYAAWYLTVLAVRNELKYVSNYHKDGVHRTLTQTSCGGLNANGHRDSYIWMCSSPMRELFGKD